MSITNEGIGFVTGLRLPVTSEAEHEYWGNSSYLQWILFRGERLQPQRAIG